MGCTTCSGNPNTWCTQCMPAEDTWVAPVDKLPDVFMGDRDHMYLLPNGDLYILSPDRTKWIKVNGQGGATYDDTEVLNRIKALEGKTDNFISSVGVSRNGNRVKLTYTLVDGTIKEVEFEDKDTVALAYDDTALKSRIKALEDKPDKDEQKLSLDGNKLKLTNGGEVDLSKYDTPVARYTKRAISTEEAEGAESIIPLDNLINKYGVKEGDIVQDIIDDYTGSGALKFNYWVVSEIIGDNAHIFYLGQSLTHGYADELRDRITALENKPTSTVTQSPVHRFYNGDIPGRADSNVTKTVSLNNIKNGDGIKVGDTVEDYYADKSNVNRGIWKVTKVDGNNITVQGIGNYDINLKKFLTFDQNTRKLSIENGNTVTLPNDKQTITKQGNRLVLSNGGGEVELPTPKDSVPYDDKALRDRITALEGRTDNDKQTLSFNTTTRKLSISDGNSVDIPDEKQKLSLSGNTLSLTDGGSVTLPQQTPYNDTDVKRRLTALEGKPDNDKQTLSLDNNTRRLSISNGNNVILPNDKQTISISGNTVSLSNGGGSISIPQPNLSGYVPIAEYNKLKGALENLLQNLKNSGAWNQTGGTIFEGSLRPDRNIATGNINLFGGTVDGNAFIRTNNGKTENDLAGGIN